MTDHIEPPSNGKTRSDAIKDTKSQFDDLVRRIDHHAHILRVTPVDFFRTAILTQAAALFSILSIVFNYQKLNQDQQKTAISGAMSISIQAITLTLGIGILFSMIGYGFCYYTAREGVADLRKQMDRHLFKGKGIRITPWKHGFSWFLFFATGQAIILFVVVGWTIAVCWIVL